MKKLSLAVICLIFAGASSFFYSFKPVHNAGKNPAAVGIESGLIWGVKTNASDVRAFSDKYRTPNFE